MRIAAIDFETANSNRDSICSVGLVTYNNGEVTQEIYSLIKPIDAYFDSYNTFIHGITYEDVKNAPRFDQKWDELFSALEDHVLIAHNAVFDISCLRHTLEASDISFPHLKYNCTRNIAKKYWPGLPSYRLYHVANAHLGLEFKHHNALEDAKAAGFIFHKVVSNLGVSTHDELVESLNLVNGELFTGGYKPARINKKNKVPGSDFKELLAQSDDFDISHQFFGANVAFTGTLQSMTRKEAAQMVINLGGSFEKGITKKTNYLVMGDQDFSRFTDGYKSSKLIKAENHIKNGQNLEIIPEKDFVELI